MTRRLIADVIVNDSSKSCAGHFFVNEPEAMELTLERFANTVVKCDAR
jgi:hypothetical protein